jgi:hypothetical protein
MKLRKITFRKYRLATGIFILLGLGQLPLAHATSNASNGSRVAGVSRYSNNMEVFWVDASGAIDHAFWNGGDWGAVIAAYGGANNPLFAPDANLTAVSRDADHWEIFYPSADGYLDHVYWDASSGQFGPYWVKWSINNVAPYGGLSAVSRDTNYMDVFYVTPNQSIQHVYWASGSDWSDPITVAGGGTVWPNSSVAAISRNPNTIEVFWVGTDRSLQHAYWYQNQPWAGPYALTNANTVSASSVAPNPGIAVVSRDPTKLEVFFVGNDNTVHHVWWSEGVPENGFWSGNYQVPGPATVHLGPNGEGGSLAAISRATNAMEFFYYGNFWVYQVAHSWWDGSSWNNGGAVNGSAAAGYGRGGIAAVYRSPTQMEVWYNDSLQYMLQDLNFDPSYGWHTQTLPRYLPLALHPQQESHWCWAATEQMVAEFFGVGLSQCQLATEKALWGTNCCPPQYNNWVYDLLCNSMEGCFDLFSKGFWYDATWLSGCLSIDPTGGAPLTFAELQHQFAINQPVAFGWRWTVGGGHFMVATDAFVHGDGSQMVTVFDPSGGVTDMLYTYWVDAPDHQFWMDATNFWGGF